MFEKCYVEIFFYEILTLNCKCCYSFAIVR